ncbi:MAG: hypothetical protein ACXWX4_10560 [Actinomycetota bacterium]
MKVSKKLTIGALFAGAMLAGSIAFAAWTATGSGSGYAKATSAQPLTTVDVSGSTVADLYPGATGDVLLRIDNPNPYPVTVTNVTGSGAIDSSVGACDGATGVTFTDQSSLTLDVAANSAATFTLADSVAMSNASHTSCQGAIFTVPVTLSGLSDATP